VAAGFGVHHEWGKLRKAIVADVPGLSDLLRQEGVQVHSVATLSPRDPLIVVGRRFIESSVRPGSRRREHLALQPTVRQLAQHYGVEWSYVPPGSSDGVDGPYLEGGDVLLNGYEVYVGMSGQASDMAGIDWLEVRLGPAYRVIPIAMRSSVLHLDDVLALVRPGLLICCPSLLIDGLPEALRDWDPITALPEETSRNVAQILVLEPGRAVVAARSTRIAEELRLHGIEVISLTCDIGLRSAHQPLWRESVLE